MERASAGSSYARDVRAENLVQMLCTVSPQLSSVVPVTSVGYRHGTARNSRMSPGTNGYQKAIAARSRVRNVVLDTGAVDLAERIAIVVQELSSHGRPSATSCIGVGLKLSVLN